MPRNGVTADPPTDPAQREFNAVLAASTAPLVPHDAACFPPEAAKVGHGPLYESLKDALATLRCAANDDPFPDPIQMLALDVSRRLEAGEVGFSDIEQLIQRLTVDAFIGGAARLRERFGELDPAANAARLRGLFERLGHDPVTGTQVPFEAFRARVERAAFGIVVTAHPTFSLTAPLMRIQTQLATDRALDGRPLDTAARSALIHAALAAEHRPEAAITLDVEHALSLEALGHLQDALARVYQVALEVAETLYPEDWLSLTPIVLTLASWVGYDLDGRSDISWSDTFEKRLTVQRHQLVRYRVQLRALIALAPADAAAEPMRHILELLASRIDLAIQTVEGEIDIFGQGRQVPVDWPQAVARVARRMVADQARRLTEAGPLLTLIARAIDGARGLPELAPVLRALLVLRAELANSGLGIAHTHVRINATQLHNAIRKTIGMTEAPDDPSHRRSYLAAVGDLLAGVEPVTVNFGSVMAERASAKRLFMVLAQMLKFVDATTPIRFLIAETETAFTLLTALYYAKLFGVADKVEISPLFETRRALERGARVIDEALQNPHFRAYVVAQGRLCVQTGYSDAGRYLGQTVAAAAIERLRVRIGDVLKQHALPGVELVVFDTHGESIGRGAHPAGFADRLRYVSSAASRGQLAANGIPLKQEVSFQGGDGYMNAMSPVAALATVTRILEFALAEPDEVDDPYSVESGFVNEFFTTIQFFNDRVMADPDYGALLGVFGANMLHPSGSRPRRRQHEGGGPADVTSPRQLRAIPHNAILQQLGYLANTIGGVGQAMKKDPEGFAEFYRTSPRFRRLFGMVAWARAFSDMDVLKAYIDTMDPGLWLLRADKVDDREHREALRRVADYLEQANVHRRLAAIFRVLFADVLDFEQELARLAEAGALDAHDLPGIPADLRDDLHLLHAVRIALIHAIYTIATHVPEFSPQHETTPEELHARILHLDIDGAVAGLAAIFPKTEPTELPTDFGEPASYRSDGGQSYEIEHATIFQPMERLHALIRRTSTGIRHIIGAIG